MTDSLPRATIMLGAGGHARVLQESLESTGVRLSGFVAPEPASQLVDVEWLGGDSQLDRLDPAAVFLVNGIGSTSSPALREQLFETARARGFEFRTVVDPSANLKKSALLGQGVQILSGAIVGSSVQLEDDVIVNTGSIIDHDSIVGAHSHISPGVVLAGGVRIGEGSHIGLGARAIQGVTIGSHCTIGAGAVVIGDIPDNSLAVGVPAVHRLIT